MASSLLSRLLFFCSSSPSVASLPYASNLFHSITYPTLSDYNAIIRTQSSSFSASMSPFFLYIQMLAEAETLIRSMPMEPDSFVWGALLGACRMHGNVELGERIAGYLMERDPLNHAVYIVLSDIYAKVKRYEDVKRIWHFMKKMGIKKNSPGCSMIDVGGQVREFSLKGTEEELLKEINWVLDGISAALKSARHEPVETEFIFE
ncbi:hypothetical protein IEQ34_013960 [Dendrobium chrysotoxum]|uniref:Pentatricopeptide repeat-containing protein n=1 Tax=Dendrobium chrysotoxum TaxID=161865 RepID=A0AAV7GK80_DENCH|nr:hypothetical protein IEQ34_013960 [Dendrobium chrysotoxum]